MRWLSFPSFASTTCSWSSSQLVRRSSSRVSAPSAWRPPGTCIGTAQTRQVPPYSVAGSPWGGDRILLHANTDGLVRAHRRHCRHPGLSRLHRGGPGRDATASLGWVRLSARWDCAAGPESSSVRNLSGQERRLLSQLAATGRPELLLQWSRWRIDHMLGKPWTQWRDGFARAVGRCLPPCRPPGSTSHRTRPVRTTPAP